MFASFLLKDYIPLKAIKLKDTIAPATSVAGTPLKVSGISATSNLERTPEKIINTNVKPTPTDIALTIDCT